MIRGAVRAILAGASLGLILHQLERRQARRGDYQQLAGQVHSALPALNPGSQQQLIDALAHAGPARRAEILMRIGS